MIRLTRPRAPPTPRAPRRSRTSPSCARGTYDDDPNKLADRIRRLLDVPRADRPRVVFYSAAAWNNDVTGLVDALTPLEAQGVRFVSASAGLTCVRQTPR